MHDNAARMYAAADRGFVMPDPLRLGTPHGTYQRSGNDPVNMRDPSGLCEHGSFNLQVTVRQSATGYQSGRRTFLGVTLQSQTTLECSPEGEPAYVSDNNPSIHDCWQIPRTDVDMASVMKTSDCTGRVTILVTKPGTDLQATYTRNIRTFHVDQRGRDTIVWHEQGHAAILRAYLRAFWEAAKKSLGGADSGRGIEDASIAKPGALAKWNTYWAKLSTAMKEKLRELKTGPQDGLHGMTMTDGRPRGRAANGNTLVNDQRYSIMRGGPRSHETNAWAQRLQRTARYMGARHARKSGLNKFPCQCKH